MGTEYTGPGGTRVHYGPRLSPSLKPDPAAATENTLGTVRELEIRFGYDDLPGWSASSVNDAVKRALPAHAAILDAVLRVEEAFVGGTSLEVGTVNAATGTVVDADGLIPAAVGVTANLALGNLISGRGAQVIEAPDATGAATVDGDGVYTVSATGPIANVATLVRVAAVGTYTAGRARLTVRYSVLAN